MSYIAFSENETHITDRNYKHNDKPMMVWGRTLDPG